MISYCLNNYYSLLAEKRKELGDAAAKLKNGLDRIDETRAKVCNNSLTVALMKKRKD